MLGLPRCSLQVDPTLIDAFLATGSIATLHLGMPNDPLLLNNTIYCQGADLDASANAFGAIVADSSTLQIGTK
ncbi:MAG: hypothetical protein AB8H80_11940 [Planctomycetota bacterium]